MNVKRRLEQRIRGWFPREPNPKMPSQQLAQPQPIKPEAPVGVRSMSLRSQLVILLVVAVFVYFSWSGTALYSYNIGLELAATGWIIGLFAGAVASLQVTNSELKLLSHENRISKHRYNQELIVLALAFMSIFFFVLFNYSSQVAVLYIGVGIAFIVGWGILEVHPSL